MKISAEPSCVWTPHTGPKKTNFPSLGKMLSSLKGYYCFIVVAGMSEDTGVSASRGNLKGSFCWVKNTTVDYIYHLSPTYPPIMWLTLLEVPNKDSNILKVLLFTQLNGQSCVVVLLNFISKSMISIHSSRVLGWVKWKWRLNTFTRRWRRFWRLRKILYKKRTNGT